MADQLIDEVINEKAFTQLERMVNLLVTAEGKIVDINKTAKQAEFDIKGAKNLQDFSTNAEKATRSIDALGEATKEYQTYTIASQAVLQKFGGTMEQNIRLQVQQKARLDEIGRALKEQKAAYDNGMKSLNEYTNDTKDLIKEQQQLKLASSELTQSIKSEIKEVNAAGTSYDEMNARLGRLRDTYRKLSAEDRNGSAGTALLGQINTLDADLKKMDATLGNHQRNVGNYSGALTVLESALADVRSQLQQNGQAVKLNEEQLAQLRKEEELLNALLKNQVNGFASATQELKNNEKALQALQNAGLQTTEFYKKLLAETAGLKDNVSDLKAEIKNLASDTSTIDGLVGSAQALAGAWGIATAAAQLLGDDNEELQKSMVKLQAVTTIMIGLQQIANALQKESSVMLLLTSVRTKAVAAAQTLYTFATTGATAATKAFRAALVTTGIGALLVGLGLLIAKLSDHKDAAQESADRQRDLNNAMNEGSKAARDAALTFLDQEMRLEIANAKLKGKNEAEIQSIRDKYSKLRMLSLEQYRDELVVAGKEQLDAENAVTEEQIKNIEEKADREEKARGKKQQQDEKAAQKAKELAEKIAEESAAINRKEVEASLALQRRELEFKADAQLKIAENEEISFAERLEALKKYYQLKKNIEEGDKSKDINDLAAETIRQRESILKRTLTDKEKISLLSKLTKEVENIEDEHNKNIENKTLEHNSRISELHKEQMAEEVALKLESIFKLQESLERQLQEEELALAKSLSAKKISTEEYEKQKDNLQRKYAQIANDEAISALQMEIDRLNWLGEETKTLQDELNEYRKKKRAEDVEDAKRSAEKKAKAERQFNEVVISSSAQSGQAVLSVAQTVYENQLAKSEEKLASIVKERDAEIDKLKNVGLSEEQIARQTAEIKGKYYQQEVEQNRNIARIKRKAAIAERAAALLSIAANTATAIMKQFAELPLAAAIVSSVAIGLAATAQTYAVVSKPIPEYREGVDFHPGGLAILGDGGENEWVKTPGQKGYWSPATDTLMNLPKGTSVTPMSDIMQSQIGMLSPQLLASMGIQKETMDAYMLNSTLKQGFDTMNNTMKNFPQTNLEIKAGELIKTVKRGNDTQTWINQF